MCSGMTDHSSCRQTVVNNKSIADIDRFYQLQADVVFFSEYVSMHALWRCKQGTPTLLSHSCEHVSNEHISQVWECARYYTIIVYVDNVVRSLYFEFANWNMTIKLTAIVALYLVHKASVVSLQVLA